MPCGVLGAWNFKTKIMQRQKSISDLLSTTGVQRQKKDRAELYYQLANNAHLNNQFNPALKYLDSSLMDYRLIKTKGIFK